MKVFETTSSPTPSLPGKRRRPRAQRPEQRGRAAALRAAAYWAVVAACLAVVAPAPAGAMVVTMDSLQSFTPPPDPLNNFEAVLNGDQTSMIVPPFVNSFPAPNTVAVSLVGGNTQVAFSGGFLGTDPTNFQTFGYTANVEQIIGGQMIANSQVIDKNWTRLQDITGFVPEQNVSFSYNTVTQSLTVTVNNDPNDVFSLFSVGFRVTTGPIPITALNRTSTPPGSFTPSGIPDGTTLGPGGSVSFVIPAVAPGSFVTAFADARFSGTSAGNPYKDLSGFWAEFEPLQSLPEPSSVALMGSGAVTLLALAVVRLRRRDGRRAP